MRSNSRAAAGGEPRERRAGGFSVEGVDDAVAGVEGVGSGGHPVGHDDRLEQRVEGHVHVADAHAPHVEGPAENPKVRKANLLNLSLQPGFNHSQGSLPF